MAHKDHTKIYFLVFAALMVLLVLTVSVAYLHLGALALTITLLIAATKAAIVMLFFMHVKYSSPISRIFALAGVVWLGIMLALTFSDFQTRGWQSQPRPQPTATSGGRTTSADPAQR
ncbi:MAG: cytochrome C oxidase subunit IV family protein [Phycisphaeraceae bacterium]